MQPIKLKMIDPIKWEFFFLYFLARLEYNNLIQGALLIISEMREGGKHKRIKNKKNPWLEKLLEVV